jgi:hypothetical protein
MSDAPLLGRTDAVPRRRWRWLLPLVIVVALALLVGALVVRSRSVDRGTAKYALNQYLSAVQDGDTNTAFALLCAGGSTPTAADFAAQVARERQNFGGVVGHRMGSVRKLAGGDQTVTYTVQYEATYRFYAARMTHKTGEWRVCGFREIDAPTP